MIGLRILIR